MSDDFSFAPPPFDADAALQRCQRELRDAGLTARADQFERKGVAIARLRVEAGKLHASRVKRPSRKSPEWQPSLLLGSSAQVRDFVAELKARLAQWTDRDD